MALMEDARSRKLAPIYSALESGNWRQAIRLCEKRDVEKWLTTKALKANGLWRMGRFDEALQLCLEVQATLPGKWTQELLDSLSKLPTAGPTDEDTLAAMSFNYRMMNRRDEVTSMFEAAVKARPADSSLLKELFMCHVRAKHYLKAQQTATKLHKLDPQGGKYIVWAAATMLLQSERGEGVAGTKTMLPLAERMAVKVLQEKAGRGCRPVGEELRLYLEILKLQGKHRESLEALEKFEPPPGEASTGGAAGDIEDESSLENGTIVHMQELERMELKAELYEKLGSDSDFAQAEIIWRDLLRRVPDQWSYYTALLDLTEKRYGLTRCMQGASSAEWITPLTSIWQLIRDIQPQHSRLRGPFLAEMELLKRSVAWFGGGCRPPSLAEADKAGSDPAGSSTPDEGEAETLVDALCRCLERYVSTFSPKLCCFHDIRPYLAVFLAVGDGTLSEDLIPGLNNLKVFFRREADESRVSDEEACSPRKPGGDGDPPALGQGERDAGAKRLHRYICACQARRFLRDFMVSDGNPEGGEGEGDGVRDVEDGDAVEETAKRYRQVAHDLTLQYRATLHLNHGSEGGQREVQHGDELVLLAARLLLRLCELYDHRARCGDATSESKAYLVRVEVICLLEAALSCSPYNHYMKILAIDVYWQLGSFARGIALFNNLDVKQIQVDTLSYLIVEPSHSLGMFTESQAQCRGIRMVHRNCQNETAEHVARAFDRGNYSKGAEMDRFQREKLDRSLQLALAKAEKVAMDVVTDQQTYISAARRISNVQSNLQMKASPEEMKATTKEDALSDDGGGVSFPGDAWLEGQVENMDYSVQADRCWFRSPEDEAAIGKSRRADLLASLKIRLLANNAMLVALKGDPASEVDKVVKRLEGAVAAATRIQHGKKGASTTLVDEKEAPNGLGAATASMAKMKVSGAGAVWFEMSELPWRLFAETSRALALVHQGIGEDSDALASATEAMRRAVEHAKACRRILKESGRHICTLEGGASKGKQNEVPLRPEWIRAWSNWVANGGVYTCLLLQALGAELPADKKKGGKSKGKGKAKGKGKSVTSSAAGAGGEAGGTSSDIPRAQDALSALGAEVTGLLRGLVTALKSETSAKGDPSDPGDTLAQLLKGEMGVTYQAAIGVLWGAAADRWFKDDKAVQRALAGIGSGQATSCQRLLAVASQHLSTLQRWER